MQVPKNRDSGGGSKTKKSTKLFFSGIIILTISNLLMKAIGLLFKIPLNHIVGDTGMGYFNSAYAIYVTFFMVSTAGLPMAVALLISESRAKGNVKQVKRIFNVSVMLFFIIGLVGMFAMMFGSKAFSSLMKSEPTYLCIIAIAPTLFFICISSAIRGFFQGYQQMVPTAISQLIESLCKLLVGIMMAMWSISAGYEIHETAAFTVLGLTVGAALGMIFLVVSKMIFKESKYNEEFIQLDDDQQITESVKVILKRLVIIAIPITLSASLLSLANFIDAIIVQNRLQAAGMTQIEATTVFGNYTTLAVPMFNLPPALIYPISYSIIPMIRAVMVAGDKARAKLIMESSLRVAVLVAVPSALGLSALAKPILNLFYTSKSVEMAAPLLSILALSVFFLCVLSVTNAILQACGHERKPIISMVVGAVVKLVSSYILIGIPGIGIYGTPISTFLCYLTVTSINFYFVAKYVGIVPKVRRVFVRPFAAAVLCMISAVGAYALFEKLHPGRLATLGAIFVAVVVYAVLIFVFKAISKEDMLLLPKGKKLCAVLEKMKLIK